MIETAVAEEIRKNVSGEVLLSEPLSSYTTYRTGGEAELLIVAENNSDLQWVYRFARKNGFPLNIIGAGSNIIVPDSGVEGIILKTKGEGARIDFRDDGTVGGAVVMNAGTKDGDISAIIDSVEVVASDGEQLSLTAGDMGFRYRTSIFQQKDWLIISVVFKVIEVDGEQTIKNIDRIWKERGRLYPMQLPNAGSVFRNPEGSHAGFLIEEAGCKGMKVGGAEVSEKHGNFIINTGGATSSDIINLIELVRERVFEKNGINLVLEQKILSTRIDQ
jgi:UDP-N-acetylmuramate dehydrogenase